MHDPSPGTPAQPGTPNALPWSVLPAQLAPSLQVGLDGYANPRSTDPNAQTMRDRRVGVVRDALIQAGVPADKIRTGAFGEGRLTCNDSTEACQQRDRRVKVLIRTGN